jgi:hypothetical protein
VHFIITDAWLAKSRAVHLSGTRLMLSLMALSLRLMVFAAGLYHWVFLKGAREGWPVIGALVRLVEIALLCWVPYRSPPARGLLFQLRQLVLPDQLSGLRRICMAIAAT